MAPGIVTDRRSNLLGSLWMIASMAGFAAEDSLLKLAAQTLPIGQMLIIFGIAGALVFAAIALAGGARLFTPDVLSRPMRVRMLFEVGGRLFYVLALALIPLSTATVILQATPLVVVGAAAIVFGERVGWRRWTAICTGLIGVVIIIQPGATGFSALSILAVIGMLGFAGRDLASRAAPPSLSAPVLGFYGFIAIIIAGVIYAAWQGAPFVMPDTRALLFLCGAVLTGVTAYTCLMKAMRTGEVSAVTPFRYTRLLFGIGLGVLAFGEKLTPAMLIGSGLIVISGLIILWRGKQVAHER